MEQGQEIGRKANRSIDHWNTYSTRQLPEKGCARDLGAPHTDGKCSTDAHALYYKATKTQPYDPQPKHSLLRAGQGGGLNGERRMETVCYIITNRCPAHDASEEGL